LAHIEDPIKPSNFLYDHLELEQFCNSEQFKLEQTSMNTSLNEIGELRWKIFSLGSGFNLIFFPHKALSNGSDSEDLDHASHMD